MRSDPWGCESERRFDLPCSPLGVRKAFGRSRWIWQLDRCRNGFEETLVAGVKPHDGGVVHEPSEPDLVWLLPKIKCREETTHGLGMSSSIRITIRRSLPEAALV